jgi:DNA-binding transcriptional ArsR family regulator
MTNEREPAGSPARRFDYQASPSLAADLCWVTSVAVAPAKVKKGQIRAEVFKGREELADRVRAFWEDGATDSCFTEMQVLAHHSGATTETSPTALWTAIEDAVDSIPLDLGLESEWPEERERFLKRLEKLKGSPALVRRYVELLQEVWEPLDDVWQAALPVMYETGQHALEQLQSTGKPFNELFTVTCEVFESRLPTITSVIERGQTLMIVPCYYFGCSMYLELAGMTMIGTGLDQHGTMARARTESVARRLKTVADPTRLALLHFLSARPSSVGELAASFGLAQPTVSMHVKLLRETGLVRAERQAGRLQLSADPGAVDALLSDLRGVVAQPGELQKVG